MRCTCLFSLSMGNLAVQHVRRCTVCKWGCDTCVCYLLSHTHSEAIFQLVEVNQLVRGIKKQRFFVVAGGQKGISLELVSVFMNST